MSRAPGRGDPVNPSLAALREMDAERTRALTLEFAATYEHASWQTLGATRWLGHSIVKPPSDIISLQEIVTETRPDLIIETGVFGGGSAFLFATLMDLLGIEGQVIGIDLNVSTLPRSVIDHPRIRLIEGSSTDPKIIENLRQAAVGKRVMVDLDSDHSTSHVAAELRALAPLVSPGCYLVVEDTWLGGNPITREPGQGPLAALEEWLAQGQPFMVDRWRERFLLTSNPGGYLLREGKSLMPEPRREEYLMLEIGQETGTEWAPPGSPPAPPSPERDLDSLAADERRAREELTRERESSRAEIDALRSEVEVLSAYVKGREQVIARQRQRIDRLGTRSGRLESGLRRVAARARRRG